MTTYKVRTLKPEVSPIRTVTADSPEDAAQELLFRVSTPCVSYIDREDPSNIQLIQFALVEVEGKELFARTYHKGIFRLGARSHVDRSALMAKLGWTGTWEELLAPWEGESEDWT